MLPRVGFIATRIRPENLLLTRLTQSCTLPGFAHASQRPLLWSPAAPDPAFPSFSPPQAPRWLPVTVKCGLPKRPLPLGARQPLAVLVCFAPVQRAGGGCLPSTLPMKTGPFANTAAGHCPFVAPNGTPEISRRHPAFLPANCVEGLETALL